MNKLGQEIHLSDNESESLSDSQSLKEEDGVEQVTMLNFDENKSQKSQLKIDIDLVDKNNRDEPLAFED